MPKTGDMGIWIGNLLTRDTILEMRIIVVVRHLDSLQHRLDSLDACCMLHTSNKRVSPEADGGTMTLTSAPFSTPIPDSISHTVIKKKGKP
jgi:hypothetical protein